MRGVSIMRMKFNIRRMKFNRTQAAAIAAALLPCLTYLIGCTANAMPPEDRAGYSQSLDKYYEGRPMCLWADTVSFPIEATPGQADERGFDALVDAGLLMRRRASKSAPDRAASGAPGAAGAPGGGGGYDLTPEGRSALDRDVLKPGAGNFCYGKRQVVSIDAARENSTTTEIVDYRFSVAEPASWAREYTIQTAFPQIVPELASPHKAEVTLLNTTEGWEVSGTPAILQSMPPATPRTSALARARSLLHLHRRQSS